MQNVEISFLYRGKGLHFVTSILKLFTNCAFIHFRLIKTILVIEDNIPAVINRTTINQFVKSIAV